MRMPSAKSLLATFRDLTPEVAHFVRRIGHAVDDAAELQHLIESLGDVRWPRTLRYVKSLGGNPYTSQMWRVTVAMYAMDELCDTHGVECLGASTNQPTFYYLNVGDPYVATIVYTHATNSCHIACWGDVVEKAGV